MVKRVFKVKMPPNVATEEKELNIEAIEEPFGIK